MTITARLHQQRQARWVGRPTPVDVALAVVLSASALALVAWAPRAAVHRSPDATAVTIALASGATLAWWRARPLPALSVACALVVVNSAAGHAVGAIQYPVWLALYSVLASTAELRRRASAIALVTATVIGYGLIAREPVSFDVVVGIAIMFALAVLGGEITRTRRLLAEADRLQLTLAASQETAMRDRAVLQERARLARELHDALGHAVNVMVMQAGVGRHVFDERPDYARAALGQIETVGRDAVVELDGVLQALGSDDDPIADRSTPSLAGLDTLCDRIRATGRAVRLHVDSTVSLSPSGERAAYRIVQEAITNAARHGRPGPIEVSVESTADHVVLTVRNPAGSPWPAPAGSGSAAVAGSGSAAVAGSGSAAVAGSGRGLMNMRARARLEGGDLDHGPAEGVFVVRATLPASSARTR